MGSKQSKDGKIRLAIVGPKGCGKSAFVNAIRGFSDDHKHAAKVDVDTMERHDYTYPTNPLVIFCDLPGYDEENYPNLETYWNTYDLEKFDGLLIFTGDEMTEFDRALAKKVKSFKKSFSIIRAHIDIYISKIQREDEETLQLKEEEHLEKIKDTVVEHLRCDKEDIFLINNYDPRKWDFFRLIEAIINSIPFPPTDNTDDFIFKYLADGREDKEKNGVFSIEEFLKKKLEEWKKVKIRFAVTGDAGTGKSSFINAIRGLKDDDKGAAKVDVTEATLEATEYEHPGNPKITFVDLPGIGTSNYPDLPTYCKKVDLEENDTFLILTTTRFTKHELELAEKVKSIGKSFFLVRPKIDNDCNAESKKRTFNEKEMLERIKIYCFESVKDLISSEKEIFLISNHNLEKWDFDPLVTAINDKMTVLQGESLALSLPNLTRECVKTMARFLKARAVVVAAVSAMTGASPLPGMKAAVDLPLIYATITFNYKIFGLNEIPSENINMLDEKYREIIKRYQFTLPSELLPNILTMSGVEEVSKYIPIVGIDIAGSKSFAATLHYLTRSVNEMEEAALVVWDDATKQLIQDNLF